MCCSLQQHTVLYIWSISLAHLTCLFKMALLLLLPASPLAAAFPPASIGPAATGEPLPLPLLLLLLLPDGIVLCVLAGWAFVTAIDWLLLH